MVIEIMSDVQYKKLYIENECSTIYVCRIVLQNFSIKIQKPNCNIKLPNISHLLFDVMCFSIENKMLTKMCQMNQQFIDFLKQPANKNGANVLTLCQGPTVNDMVKNI